MNPCQRFLILLLCLCTQSILGQNVGEENLQEKGATAYEMANSEYFLVEAEKYVLLEDYDKALINLDKAIELDKANHAAFFKKAEILSFQESFEEAATAIETAIQLNQSNKYYYVLAAQIRKQQNDNAGLATIYALMVENTTGWEIYGEEAVNAFVGNGQSKEALALLEPLIIYFPNHPELWLKKAELELKSNKIKRGINTLKEAHLLFPKEELILQAYVQALFANNNLEEAENTLLASSQLSLKARLMLLEFYMTQNRYQEVEPLVLENFNDDSADLETKVLSISYLLANESLLMLADSLQSALDRNYPEESLVFESGGFVYTKIAERYTGDEKLSFTQKAITSFKRAAELNPNNFDAWLKVFEFEIDQGEWKALEKDVEYLLDLYPNQAILYYYYAKAFKGQDDLGEAIRLVDQGLRMSSRNERLTSIFLSEKALIISLQGNNDLADETFNQALNTGNIDERAIYAYAQWLLNFNPSASTELINTFSNSLSKGSKWTILKMKAYAAQDLHEDVSQVATEFIKNYPQGISGELCELFGDALFQLGQSDAALEQWQKALTLGGYSEKLEEKIANKSIN